MFNFNAASHELIGLLLPEGETSLAPAQASGRARPVATALVRKADGQIALEAVADDATLARSALATGCFRRKQPIIDPVSREVMGYEMEMTDSPP